MVSDQLNAGNTQFTAHQEEGICQGPAQPAVPFPWEQLGQDVCEVAPSEQPWDAGKLLASMDTSFQAPSWLDLHVWDFIGSQREGEGASMQLSMECFGRGRSCLSSPVPAP